MTLRVGRPGIQLFNTRRYFTILLTFLFLLPKGGFKLGGIPLTWGYLFLIPLAIGALFSSRFKIQKNRTAVLFYLLPFQAVAATTMILAGTCNPGMTVSFWISFFFLPYCFLFLFSQEIEEIDTGWLFSFFTKGMLFLALYGIALFIVRGITGKFFEIPLLTTNFSDYGTLNEKCNARYLFAKLISTYNNGNLYGACLIMALPLYCYLEKSTYKLWLIKLSFLLTLSRTVWLGLFFSELFYLLLFSKDKAAAILKIVLTMGSFILILCGAALWIGLPSTFFFDTTLGGRDDQIQRVQQIGLLGTSPFDGIVEVVYVGVAHSFGWLGLFTFLIAMCLPLLLRLTSLGELHPIHRAIALGLLNYLFISFSDGAILYLPTMAFYWFFLSLLYRRNFPKPLTPALL